VKDILPSKCSNRLTPINNISCYAIAALLWQNEDIEINEPQNEFYLVSSNVIWINVSIVY
jgi:hypothetical protein